jgi:hypothetical protein
MSNQILSFDVEHTLGWVGLFLMLVIAALANRGYAVEHSITGRVSSFLARRAIDGIAVIGWLADHVPPITQATGPRDQGPGLRRAEA